MLKFALFIGLFCSLTGMLLQAADYVPRETVGMDPHDAADFSSIPIDYEHTGSDAEYVHGKHCIDGRSF